MLGLKNVSLKITYPQQTKSIASNIPDMQTCGLLYPSKNAIDLSSLPTHHMPKTLVVLDGTWSKALKLYKENPWLHNLTHYSLYPSQPSRYRIRLEPTDNHISTLEAIIEALKILEPATNCQSLLHAFDQMIDTQIGYITSKEGVARRKRPRIRERRSIPKLLSDSLDNVVVAYSENVRLENHERILVSLCAQRLGDGAFFQQFLSLEKHLAHKIQDIEPSGILDHHCQYAVDESTFLTRWNQYLRGDDVLCAWNKGTLKGLFALTGVPTNKYLFLKAAYGNTVKTKFGTLEDVISTAQISTLPTAFKGRAAQRMSNAIGIATYLHKKATEPKRRTPNT